MTRIFPLTVVYIIILSTLLQRCQIHCLRRLMRRKLSSEDISSKMSSDDIRNLVYSSLASNNHRAIENNKRDTSSDQAKDAASIDTLVEDNVASESKDNAMYDDEVDEDDGGQQLQQQLDESEYKRSADASSGSNLADQSVDQSDLASYDEPDVKEVKDVSKREAKNEDDYEEEMDANNNLPEPSGSLSADRKDARSILPESNEESQKQETPREVSAEANSDLDYEKEIEDQIQQRIDSIKEDIKREIERKQQVRAIEANNAKYDELELNRENDDLNDNGEVDNEDSSKRLISRDSAAGNNEARNIVEGDSVSTRTKRSGLSDIKVDDNKNTPLAVPIKKRSFERHVTLVEKGEVRNPRKRQSRSASILIPERGHAEVKDDLPSDLILDPHLRLARSNEAKTIDNSRSSRYRRDMSDDMENEIETNVNEVDEPSNFLFAAREKPECRTRRRRSKSRDRMRLIDRRKTRKHPRHSRRHRTVRASSAEDEELDGEEREKRDMSIDEDAALEYKESFGGFQSESGGAGRFKRIRRSAKVF